MQKEVSEMTFEEAIKELEDLVQKMESGNMPLDESLAAYTRGTELAKFCRAKLQMAEEMIQKIEGETGKGKSEGVPF